MREKIGRALKARCKAIKHVLEEYNLCAAQLNPPRPNLTWTKVMDAVYIAELDILQDAWQDICSLKWAQPAHREAMNLYFGLERAKEEVLWLNVEIWRLLTFMRDDHVDYYYAIQSLIIVDPPLALELSKQWQHRNQVHENIFRRLQQTAGLPGFSGELAPGTRVGRFRRDVPHLPSWWQGVVATQTANTENDNDVGEDINEVQGPREESAQDIDGLIQFMDNLDF